MSKPGIIIRKWSVDLPTEMDTAELAERLAMLISAQCVIYLYGDLGAGKTTFSRSIIKKLGYSGHVKSPTYTLVETYHIAPFTVYHFDLYRLTDPEELEFMGIRDYFHTNSVCLIEWAEKGLGILPDADLVVTILFQPKGRKIEIIALTDKGLSILVQLEKQYH